MFQPTRNRSISINISERMCVCVVLMCIVMKLKRPFKCVSKNMLQVILFGSKLSMLVKAIGIAAF